MEYNLEKTNGICYLVSNKTILNLIFIMSRIAIGYKANDEVKVMFNRYDETLLKHECGDLTNGVNALKEINAVLSNFHCYRDCYALKAHVKNAIDTIVGKYKRHDLVYDIQTEYRKCQGVSLHYGILIAG